MNLRQFCVARCVALLFFVMPLFVLSNVSAQEEPTEIDFTIASFSCTSDPGQVSLAAGNIPDSCTPDSGAVANVALQDGTDVGSCTTDATGICKLQAPNEASVVVTLDTTTLAGSVAPRENPISTQVVTEFAGALFINLPTAPAPTAVPSELPDTGTGPESRSSEGWLYSAAIVTFASAAVALGVRRQVEQLRDR